MTINQALSDDAPGYVSLVVIAEIAWVLESGYRLDRPELFQALDGLLSTRALMVERAEIVRYALRIFAHSTADFADCLIARLAHAAGCEKILTFDRNAAKHSGMTLLR